jgi:hypothetical protein
VEADTVLGPAGDKGELATAGGATIRGPIEIKRDMGCAIVKLLRFGRVSLVGHDKNPGPAPVAPNGSQIRPTGAPGRELESVINRA